MKKVLILLIFSFLTCFVTFAQNSSNSIGNWCANYDKFN